MTTATEPRVVGWDAPDGIAARGTLIVIPGRGESAAVYARFGARLAFDGYLVRAVSDPTRDPGATGAQVRELLADPELPAPHVLVGSDSGAVFAVALIAGGSVAVDALILSGLVVESPASPDLAEWAGELAARTACPTHQKRLTDDPSFRRGALGRPVPPEWLALADLSAVDVPILGLHGADDSITAIGDARQAYASAPRARLVGIAQGRHDTLNDATHRTAAATVVLFLERLRLGADLPAIARDEVGR